jgi:NAD(P)-dependent dehydrogenase (short-subunit alcohol dehydrogenase family)
MIRPNAVFPSGATAMGYELERKIVLVTGATGFIGSRVTMALVKKGAQVRAVGRNPAKAHDL